MFCVIFVFICIASETSSWKIDDYGGHSREFQNLRDALDWNSLTWKQVSRQRRFVVSPPNYSDDEIEDYIQSHRSAHDFLKDYFLKKFEKSWLRISSRIKDVDSLKIELIDKNYPLNEIRNVIGLRFTLQTVSDVRQLLTEIEKDIQPNFWIIEKLCYGICTESTENYRHDGYRRIHLLVLLPAYNKTAELQLGTSYTDFWSDWNHDMMYRGDTEPNEEVKTYSRNLAKYFYQLDEERARIPSCPLSLQYIKDVEIAGQEHLLPNLCFNWLDIYLGSPGAEFANDDASPKSKRSLLLLFISILIVMFKF